MKILGFTPLHPDYGIRPQTKQAIEAIVASCSDPIDWLYSRNDNPFDLSNDNITYQHNKARDMFLAGGYDALLSIEADMIPPADTVEGLVGCESDIAYGLYVWRPEHHRRWSAYQTLGIFGGHSFSLRHDTAKDAWGNVRDVKGLGMGCTLIKRPVLERLEFRLYDGRQDWIADEVTEAGRKMGININGNKDVRSMVHDDWLLALEAEHYGFTQRCNFGVVCGHIDHDGRILWPHISSPDLFYVEVDANGLRHG